MSNMSVTLKTVGVVAKDMAKTLAFYRLLGLAIPQEADGEHNVDFELPNRVVLGFLAEELAQRSDPRYRPFIEGGANLNLQFQFDSPAETDLTWKRLTDAGYHSYSEPWDAVWGQRFARVIDPDGRIVNLYAHLQD